MKIFELAAVGTGLMTLAGGALIFSDAMTSGRDCSEKRIKQEIKSGMTDEEIMDVKKYDELKQTVMDIYDDETEQFIKKTFEVDAANGYSKNIDAIRKAGKQQIEHYKTANSYDQKKQSYRETLESGINSWKSSHNYDNRVEKFKDDISNAKKEYEKTKNIGKIVGGDTYESLKKSAKKTRDAAVKNAENSISQLEQSLENETNRLKDIYNKQVSDLEKELDDFEASVRSSVNEQIADINEERTKVNKQLLDDIVANRSEESKTAISNLDKYDKKVKLRRERDTKELERRMEALDKTDYIADYLKSHHVGKAGTIVLASTPAPLVGYGLYKYVTFVKKIITKL
jgi:DNA repair exonuclease SbcCD ATPase subunit